MKLASYLVSYFKRANLCNYQSGWKNLLVYDSQIHEKKYRLYNITLAHGSEAVIKDVTERELKITLS